MYSEGKKLLIGGSDPFRHSFYHLLKKIGSDAIELSEDTVSKCTAVGAYKIFIKRCVL